jgi:hypothetical protein
LPKATSRSQIFRSAIVNADGTVNVGYLSLFRLMQLDTVLSVLTIGAAFWQQYSSAAHEFPFATMAAALAAIWGTFSTALAALGAFLLADAKQPSAADSNVPKVKA